jgi:uncharacterized protein DUF899
MRQLRHRWLDARKAYLVKEKEFTRQRDELSRQRRGVRVIVVAVIALGYMCSAPKRACAGKHTVDTTDFTKGGS